MSDPQEITQESPVYDDGTDEITLRERCVSIKKADGSIALMTVTPPPLPTPNEIIRLYEETGLKALEGQKSYGIEYPLPSAFDTFLMELFERYGQEYKLHLYRGLVESGLKIGVELNLNPSGAVRVRTYELHCKGSEGPIVITPPTQHWNAFLDHTETQIKKLSELHIRRKKQQKEKDLASQVGINNSVALSVSQTLSSRVDQ